MEKITLQTLNEFTIQHFSKPSQLRFGQAFMNRYLPRELNPELFYCKDFHVAYEIILDYYVEK
jgi:hypothetical protein